MSARFATNFTVLLIGAGLVVACFAFSNATAIWVSVGAGGTAIILALANFAVAHQGAYQRIADVLIALLGAWAIVGARVLDDHGRWMHFSAGVALAALGALGLLVRELQINRPVQVGEARIRADHLPQLSAMQRRAGVRP